VDLTILAIKHYPDSGPEFAFYDITCSQHTINSKECLLSRICQRDWLHTPPAMEIAEYLLQTESYKMFSRFDQACGYVINFYESDPDRPNTYSCRDIIAAPRAGVREMAKDLRDSLNQPTYSVREYA